MLNNVEFILKIIFLILSIIWVGRIMILRSDKQIVINPVLIGIGAILSVMPSSNENVYFLSISIQNIRITLYVIYCFMVLFGIYTTNRKNGIF